MKNSLKYIFIIILIFAVSCNKNESLNNPNILSKVVELDIPLDNSSKGLNTNSILTGNIEFKMDNDSEEFIGYKFSSNIIESVSISEEELYNLIDSEVYVNLDGASNKSVSSKTNVSGISACKADCQKRYTDSNGKKIKGRGWCKFGCYVDAVVEVALKILPTIVKK